MGCFLSSDQRFKQLSSGLLLLISLFGLVAAGCGTFEANSRFVTSTAIAVTTANNTIIPTHTLVATMTEVPTKTVTNRPTLDTTNIPSVVPRLSDAQIVVNINTQLIYRSTTDLGDAVSFYENQMPQDGWALVDKLQQDKDILLVFSQDRITINIALKLDWLGLLVEISTLPTNP